MAPRRSFMFVKPAPTLLFRTSNPAPSSVTSNSSPPASSQMWMLTLAPSPAYLPAF